MHGLLKDEYLFKMTQHLIGMHLSFADLEALKVNRDSPSQCYQLWVLDNV